MCFYIEILTPHISWLKYKKRGALLLLILRLEVLEKPYTQEQTMNAHADMLTVVSTQRIKHTKGHLPLSCFGCEKFSSFLIS